MLVWGMVHIQEVLSVTTAISVTATVGQLNWARDSDGSALISLKNGENGYAIRNGGCYAYIATHHLWDAQSWNDFVNMFTGLVIRVCNIFYIQ